jgi:hypothetical protein
MFPREGKLPVSPPEQVPLLVVDKGRISPILPAALHLEVVQDAGLRPAVFGLRSAPPEKPSASFHAPIVRQDAALTRSYFLCPTLWDLQTGQFSKAWLKSVRTYNVPLSI